MEIISVSLETARDEIYQRLLGCNFGLEDPGLAIFTVALLNSMGREGRGDHPSAVVLMLAFGESGTTERDRNRLMRMRRGEMSGRDLAREPESGVHREYRLGEMLMPVRPNFSAQPLFGSKRSTMDRSVRILRIRHCSSNTEECDDLRK